VASRHEAPADSLSSHKHSCAPWSRAKAFIRHRKLKLQCAGGFALDRRHWRWRVLARHPPGRYWCKNSSTWIVGSDCPGSGEATQRLGQFYAVGVPVVACSRSASAGGQSRRFREYRIKPQQKTGIAPSSTGTQLRRVFATARRERRVAGTIDLFRPGLHRPTVAGLSRTCLPRKWQIGVRSARRACPRAS